MDRPRRPGLTPTPSPDGAGTPGSRRERRTLQQEGAARPASPQTVLLACTGNICRSAFGEKALQLRIDALAPGRVDVGGVGTQVNMRLRVPPPLVAAAEEHGVTGLASHVPSQMTPSILGAADLILAATGDHMRRLLHDVPRAITRTFTLRELAALIREMDARTGGAWIRPGRGVQGFAQEASRHRALARAPGASLDIPDPYHGPDEGYARMVELMLPELDVVADALARAVAPAS
ncbi:phosphotyrosine protein phosphatase [Micrococcus porci]|uniref:arsenate reductase/protein-tyrosine-phosphatase family protein n=1 Tax=Micrococcus porci TaxID=2856555 RepID=UPI003CFAFD10